MTEANFLIKNWKSRRAIIALLGFFILTYNVFGQNNKTYTFSFNLRAEYELLPAVSKSSQPVQLIDPFEEVYRGGKGIALVLEGEKHWNKWFIIGSIGFNWQRAYETIFYKEYKMNGLAYEFMPVHQLYSLSPQIAFGREFNLSDEIALNLDAGAGFPFLLNRSDQLYSFRIYEPVSDTYSYFELNTYYSRSKPLQGSLRLQLNFPLGQNEMGLGCQYSVISPITNSYSLTKVVGLDYEVYPNETSVLINQSVKFSLVYKFGLTRK